MDKLFHPESVLIVGVSPSPRNMGRNIARNLIRWDFPGRMYLMGRKAGHLAGQPMTTEEALAMFGSMPDFEVPEDRFTHFLHDDDDPSR